MFTYPYPAESGSTCIQKTHGETLKRRNFPQLDGSWMSEGIQNTDLALYINDSMASQLTGLKLPRCFSIFFLSFHSTRRGDERLRKIGQWVSVGWVSGWWRRALGYGSGFVLWMRWTETLFFEMGFGDDSMRDVGAVASL